MNSRGLKFILLCGLIIQAGCDITFKRIYSENAPAIPSESKTENLAPDKNAEQKTINNKKTDTKSEAKIENKVETKKVDVAAKLHFATKTKKSSRYNKHPMVVQHTNFTSADKNIISAYYNNKANAIILHYALKRSPLTKNQEKQLQTNKHIPAEVKIIPLPLELDKKLSQIPVSLLRVQVGKNIILMKVSSRKIVDIVKL
jgi:hypothetical protein